MSHTLVATRADWRFGEDESQNGVDLTVTGMHQGWQRRRVLTAAVLTGMAAALFVVPLHMFPDVDPSGWWLPLDMVIHVALSAFVTMLWAWALPRASLLVLLVLGVGFAGLTEISQALPFIDRSARIQDFGYNVIGVGLGLLGAGIGRAARK
jgi:hypothetical protein